MSKVVVDARDVLANVGCLSYKVYIEVGSIVTLRSSPNVHMTVVGVSEKSLEVCWLDSQLHIQQLVLPIKSFYLISDAIVYQDHN
jgi:hypothetical protein